MRKKKSLGAELTAACFEKESTALQTSPLMIILTKHSLEKSLMSDSIQNPNLNMFVSGWCALEGSLQLVSYP